MLASSETRYFARETMSSLRCWLLPSFFSVIGFMQQAASSKGVGLAPWTQSLANAIGARSIRLSSDTSRNNDLAASLDYIVKGSGLLPLLYKSASIWGDGAPNALLAWTLGKLNDFEPNHDHRSWIKKNSADYARAFSRVDDFLASRP